MPIDRSIEGITTQQQIEKILRVPADGFFQKPKARSNVISYNSHNYYKSCKWKKEGRRRYNNATAHISQQTQIWEGSAPERTITSYIVAPLGSGHSFSHPHPQRYRLETTAADKNSPQLLRPILQQTYNIYSHCSMTGI